MDIMIRKVKRLKGKPKAICQRKGFQDDDLVIIKIRRNHSRLTYEIEKIEGEPLLDMFLKKLSVI